ncbi:MAG TPA: hypothetical protein VK698_26130 [Kofleriaceae bacterium]|nr:hypothetical protein [Kofleriaceae bacterium]
MKSRALVVGLVAAAVAMGAYLWRARSSGEDGAEGSAPAEPTSAVEAASGAAGGAARSPSDPPGPAGSGDINNDGEAPGEDGSDEAQTRDHRGEAPTAPRPRRPGEKAVFVVQAPVIGALRRSLRPEIKRCSEQLGAADLEPDARIQGTMTVTVKGGVLSVIDVQVGHRGIPDSSPFLECARKAFAAARVPAVGHPDVDKHTLRFPFNLPFK